jgi:sensor histidine kinase YesM
MTHLKGGTVKISMKQEDDAIVRVTVEDDGSGMSEEKRTEILQAGADTKGVGLWNISRRYQMLYGRTIRLESAEGRGTKVSFDIPVEREGKERGIAHAASDRRG